MSPGQFDERDARVGWALTRGIRQLESTFPIAGAPFGVTLFRSSSFDKPAPSTRRYVSGSRDRPKRLDEPYLRRLDAVEARGDELRQAWWPESRRAPYSPATLPLSEAPEARRALRARASPGLRTSPVS